MPPLIRLTAAEARLFFREPLNWSLMLPVAPILLIILGSIPAFREVRDETTGLRMIDQYTPMVVVAGLTILALSMLPQVFAAYREKGVLRRLRTTPVHPSRMLGAHLLLSGAFACGVTIIVLAIARIVFGVPMPENLLGYVLAFVLCALAMLSIGLLLAALAPSGTSAGAVGMILFFPLMFFAGLWIPRSAMNETLLTISDFSPLGAGVQAMQDAAAGDWPQLLHLAVMAGWAVLAGLLAARLFRWE
ncbi:MAG TPA: ABC transporter permease [Candidatus Nesterenkonia stercoripullorum]|uniref:Transport permease protein n=1 Tax=Candidatus Nesterenkonia stercoripullorum TaxID=2838701 RepID=A0A9D1USW6_9MICC|nr:ABC transporter permease [Candidatus Nesterenkonia stercoripullorum]